MKIELCKISENAQIIERGTPGSAGYDLFACIPYPDKEILIFPNTHKLIPTGISLAMPNNIVGIIKDRSSYAYKLGLETSAGVIDSDYRGEVGVILRNNSTNTITIKNGDKIAQILFIELPEITIELKDSLNETTRIGGYGSTGNTKIEKEENSDTLAAKQILESLEKKKKGK